MKVYIVMEQNENYGCYEVSNRYEKIDKVFATKESALKYLENYELPESGTSDNGEFRIEVKDVEFDRTKETLSYEYLFFKKYGDREYQSDFESYDVYLYITEKEVEE